MSSGNQAARHEGEASLAPTTAKRLSWDVG
jgi:hypothetical protein